MNELSARVRRSVKRQMVGADVGRDSERGSAVAEFVMVSVLLLLLLLGLLSIGLWAYTRELMISAVADSARFAANYGVSDQQAAIRASGELDGLAGTTSQTLHCRSALTTAGAAQIIALTCTMQTPGIFPILDGWIPNITVTGHALKEELHP